MRNLIGKNVEVATLHYEFKGELIEIEEGIMCIETSHNDYVYIPVRNVEYVEEIK